ncbi:C-type lectin lectoxin-Lio3-like [Anabrus simplex]|uniref:C-type lectin lectoxin-Lio3-like n=1 Tax=Anabrus simplex TaxID=316456 RepID=UPI0035A2718B
MKIIWVLLLVLVDMRRFASTENHDKSSHDSSEMKQLDSVTSVHSPLHDTSMSATKAKSCPRSGYVLFERFNCYKAYVERKNWTEARKQCKRDRGDLMVAESDGEWFDVIPAMYNNYSLSNPWMGVHKPVGCWVTVHGEAALSSWWLPGEPDNNDDRRCAFARSSGLLLNVYCKVSRSFICEIPL